MKRMRILALGLTMAGAAASLAWYLLRRPLPKTRGRVRLKGLRAKVEILRDRWGIPHIYASNLLDLLYATGYAQAQDRLWQMDLHRRLGSGTLAEILGPEVLNVDRLVRRVGFRRVAERDWEETPPEEKEMAEAFARGVNAYIENCHLPIEFSVLRYKPDPWRPVDSLTFGRFMRWTLSGNWDGEIIRSWVIEKFGAETMAELEPAYPPGGPVIVPPGTEARGPRPDLAEDYKQVAELIGVGVGRAMSNNWVVDGEKSVTGKPLLANDPHLPLLTPSVWWEVHLDCPEVKAAGVAVVSTPGVMIGHNEKIAWGVTASIVDGDDFFVERINPDNPSQYEYMGRWVDGAIVKEEIKVRGRPPVIEDVLVTRHGPIVSPAIDGEERTLALRTTALEPFSQMRVQLALMQAEDWEQFQGTLKEWGVPPLNFAYADVEGNIGYQLAGMVPLRAKGHGVTPAPGWTGEYEWTHFIPTADLPSAFNPDTHWVASANNQITDNDYPHFLSASYADKFRQMRIIELLTAKDKLSVDDFKEMQADKLSIPARELVPLILELEPRDEVARRAQVFLKAWDCRVVADSVASSIFEAFFASLVRRAVEDKVGAWADFYTGRGIHPLRPDSMFFYTAASWLLEKMRQHPDWFRGKTWREVMGEELSTAVRHLRQLLGEDMSSWQWGKLHGQRFVHPLGHVKGLDAIFNRGPIAVGGDANTLCAGAYSPYHGYDTIAFAASWRQIIDLADFNRSVASLPPGQSGHIGSKHYGDGIEMWRRVEYHPMPWSRPEVEKVTEGRLELGPEL